MKELSVSGKYEFYNDTAFETVMSELNRKCNIYTKALPIISNYVN